MAVAMRKISGWRGVNLGRKNGYRRHQKMLRSQFIKGKLTMIFGEPIRFWVGFTKVVAMRKGDGRRQIFHEEGQLSFYLYPSLSFNWFEWINKNKLLCHCSPKWIIQVLRHGTCQLVFLILHFTRFAKIPSKINPRKIIIIWQIHYSSIIVPN